MRDENDNINKIHVVEVSNNERKVVQTDLENFNTNNSNLDINTKEIEKNETSNSALKADTNKISIVQSAEKNKKVNNKRKIEKIEEIGAIIDEENEYDSMCGVIEGDVPLDKDDRIVASWSF